MEEVTLTVRPFRLGTDKECVRKLPEEAAEAFAEFVIFEEMDERCSTERLADELADVVQVCVNIASRFGIDLQAAMGRCEARNRERGRYRE